MHHSTSDQLMENNLSNARSVKNKWYVQRRGKFLKHDATSHFGQLAFLAILKDAAVTSHLFYDSSKQQWFFRKTISSKKGSKAVWLYLNSKIVDTKITQNDVSSLPISKYINMETKRVPRVGQSTLGSKNHHRTHSLSCKIEWLFPLISIYP